MERRILGRAFTNAAGEPKPYCSTCRGPTAQGPRCVILDGRKELEECPACGGCVDAEGRSLGALRPDGSVALTTIRLYRVRRQVPPPEL